MASEASEHGRTLERGTLEDPKGWRNQVRIDLHFLLFKKG